MAALVLDFRSPLPDRLYWDASFLVHAVYPPGRYHRECYGFLERLSTSPTVSYLSVLALDEAIFALLQLKISEEQPERGFWEIYRANPGAIQPYFGELRRLVDRLSSDPRIRVVGLESTSLLIGLDFMERYSLLPRDALHLSIMARYNIDSIVTTDEDFWPVDTLRIFTCNPRLLARR
ncbi:MAG: type II toxin-antitoxin system VapC family toxin [Thermoflexales bacterium]|nr:type II toxin-antitoxin system VapC family toxin [Thermoflexales bacterium]